MRKISKGSFFSPVFLQRLKIIKEHCLQLLFPRVCPVCGNILKLPKGWAALLSARCRSIFICPDCYPALSLVEDPVCRKCSKPLSFMEDGLCESCKKNTRHFDQGKSLWIHDESARKIVYDLKFRNKRDNADLIGFELAVQMRDVILKWDAEALIPVPLHKRRFRERGFNQAELIAERTSFWLSKLFGITVPVDSEYLLRNENTKPQRILDVSARARNVKHAFVVSRKLPQRRKTESRPGLSKHYHSVILVDDIFTSGATLNACAKTLKTAGAEKVFFLTATVV